MMLNILRISISVILKKSIFSNTSIAIGLLLAIFLLFFAILEGLEITLLSNDTQSS